MKKYKVCVIIEKFDEETKEGIVIEKDQISSDCDTLKDAAYIKNEIFTEYYKY